MGFQIVGRLDRVLVKTTQQTTPHNWAFSITCSSLPFPAGRVITSLNIDVVRKFANWTATVPRPTIVNLATRLVTNIAKPVQLVAAPPFKNARVTKTVPIQLASPRMALHVAMQILQAP